MSTRRNNSDTSFNQYQRPISALLRLVHAVWHTEWNDIVLPFKHPLYFLSHKPDSDVYYNKENRNNATIHISFFIVLLVMG